MALVFPLSAELLQERLRIRSVRFWRERYHETSGTARGDLMAAQIGFPKWRAEVVLTPKTLAEAMQAQSIIEAMEVPGRTFYLYNPAAAYPQDDPTGSKLGAAQPVIHTINDNVRLRVSALPANYRITRGDFLAVDYGTNPVRRALLRAAETGVANLSGLTGVFELSNPLPAGVAVGQAVMLIKPAAKMMMVPGSFEPGKARLPVVEETAFQAIEVR